MRSPTRRPRCSQSPTNTSSSGNLLPAQKGKWHCRLFIHHRVLPQQQQTRPTGLVKTAKTMSWKRAWRDSRLVISQEHVGHHTELSCPIPAWANSAPFPPSSDHSCPQTSKQLPAVMLGPSWLEFTLLGPEETRLGRPQELDRPSGNPTKLDRG